MHLSVEELIDIAEGTRHESSAPHLSRCGACRDQLTELRRVVAIAAQADVPEPSPLFWDHFSRRVGESVHQKGQAAAASTGVFACLSPSRKAIGAVAAACVMVLLIASTARRLSPGAVQPAVAPPPPVADRHPSSSVTVDAPLDEASLSLMASLIGTLDADDAGDFALRNAAIGGAPPAEHAVTHMNDEELRELGRLLRYELARPGA